MLTPRGGEPFLIGEAAPFILWPEFQAMLRRLWRPGPPDWPNTNLAEVGKAGSGKSTLARELALMRDRVVLFGTKMEDEPLYGPLQKQGYVIQDYWDPTDTRQERVIFRPPLKDPSQEEIAKQREAFRYALVRAWQVGGWTLWFDEVRYLTEQLRLKDELNLLWLQGRSIGLTILGLTQRPVSVPLNMFEQSRFLITFRITGLEDRRSMAAYAGDAMPVVMEVARVLEPKEFLFVDTELDIICRSRVEITRSNEARRA